ncbi:unnamed protein product [Hymenolepis diminuta]|uniref:C2 domain-containing protein n=1 Tax=Hymenolepis diminuta TaxID=6216 RepID=A0A564ZA83_HYMDI|nr:unnamed protein product [Hymenolepis diminuta]
MSDIDDLDYSTQLDSNSYQYSYEPPGTPSTSLLKSPTTRTLPDRMDRKHRRSVSEQIFNIRERLHKRGTVEKNADCEVEHETESGSLKEVYSMTGGSLGGWDYINRSGNSVFFNDFSPFERAEDNSMQPQSPLGKYGGHFKHALKRTVRKALNSSRTDDEEIPDGSLNESSTVARDTRHRYKKSSGERKRYQRRGSVNADFTEGRNRSDSDTEDSDSISMNAADSEEQAGDYQRKQSRIRVSLADLFSRMKRTMSVPSVYEENPSMSENCILTIRGAELKEKVNCSVHVYYMDKLISRSGFSGETNCPVWNKRIIFPFSSTEEPLELQIIEKHKVRADKLIGRAYIYLRRDEAMCSYRAPIKYFSLRKGSTQILGTLYVGTIIETGFLSSFDDSTIFDIQEGSEMPDEMASAMTSRSYTRKYRIHNRLAKKLASHGYRPHLHRSKKRHPTQKSKETLYESTIHSDSTFFFSPYEVTNRYLEGKGDIPEANIPWHPFFDWPGQRSLELPMMAVQRRCPARFWELRIPKIPWPIEFLLPMTRLCFSTANLVDSLDVGDTVKVTKIVESGFVNIYLVGARGLRSMPQVEMVPGIGTDDKSSPGTVGMMPTGSMIGGGTVSSSVGMSAMGPGVSVASSETKAASLVALHWAAKSLTLQPSPQIEFTYGSEKRSSSVVKNNNNPDFLEEFEFQVKNGSPGFVRIIVYDRETQPGTGGIPRSSIMGETLIDLTDMPLEVTQKMELQLLRNSTEARLLMFVTLTGLTTAARSPIQTRVQLSPPISNISPNSMASSPRTQLSITEFDDVSRNSQDGRSEDDEKTDMPNLPPNFLQLVSDHFSFKKSFKNYQDIGWMRLKICSAMGLGGKSTNGRIEIFCVVDMLNTHLRTQSIIKRKNPTWNRCFVIPLSDIHGIMKITVIEVEKNKAETIGGLAIHPLRVDNGGSKWYALKTPDLRGPTKGSILLEINVFFNQFKAALKSFTPMEPRYRSLAKKQKEIRRHDLRLLQQRFEHVKPLLELIRWFGRMLDDWWLWKNPIHSILGLIGYQLLVYYFQPFFIPLYMIIILLKNSVYNRESVDSIFRGLKNNKNSAQLASPHEHEIYKHQYEILEQCAINRNRIVDLQRQSEELTDYDSLDQGDSITDGSKQLLAALQDLDRIDSFNFTLPDLPNDYVNEEEEKAPVPVKSEGKKSMRTRYTGIKETVTRIFEIVEKTASFYERIEGYFSFSLPYFTTLQLTILQKFHITSKL